MNVIGRFGAALLAGCAILGVAAPAQAAQTIVVTQTLDLANILGSYSYGNQYTATVAGSLTPEVSGIDVGDTLDLTINFLPGQSLVLGATSMIWPFLEVPSEDGIRGSATGTGGVLTLLGADGQAIATSQEKDDPSGQPGDPMSFGQVFVGSDFQGDLVSTVDVTGLHYVVTLEGFQADDADSGKTAGDRIYSQAALWVYSGSIEAIVPPPPSVPEPATWAMMVGGFALTGCMMRARKVSLKIA